MKETKVILYPAAVGRVGIEREIARIGCDEKAVPVFVNKAEIIPVKIDSVPVAVANILKQEMLSSKGDAVVHREAITGKVERSGVLLLGTRSMYGDLLRKLEFQDYPTVRAVREELGKILNDSNEPVREIKVRSGKMVSLDGVAIMGILNVTENSFYDGGRYPTVAEAVKRAEEMIREGADIIDVGGESSRPGSEPVDEKTELERVVPVVKQIVRDLGGVVSVDTVKSSVAQAAFDAGAEIVNDISGLRFDKNMAKVIADAGVYTVVMHMQGSPKDMQKDPHYDNVIADLIEFFDERVEFAVDRGIERDKIIVDPGIGFGKLLEHNLEILAGLKAFGKYGLPVLVGASRKAMIGTILGGKPPEDRLYGTLGAHLEAIHHGASILRVHDVKEHREMIEIVRKIKPAC